MNEEVTTVENNEVENTFELTRGMSFSIGGGRTVMVFAVDAGYAFACDIEQLDGNKFRGDFSQVLVYATNETGENFGVPVAGTIFSVAE